MAKPESNDNMASVVRDIWGDLKSTGSEVAKQGETVGKIGIVIESVIKGLIASLIFIVGMFMIGVAIAAKPPTDEEVSQGKKDDRLQTGGIGLLFVLVGGLWGLSIYKSYVMTKESGVVASARGLGYTVGAFQTAIF